MSYDMPEKLELPVLCIEPMPRLFSDWPRNTQDAVRKHLNTTNDTLARNGVVDSHYELDDETTSAKARTAHFAYVTARLKRWPKQNQL